MRIEELGYVLEQQAVTFKDHVLKCSSEHPICEEVHFLYIDIGIELSVLMRADHSKKIVTAFVSFSKEDEAIMQVAEAALSDKFSLRFVGDIGSHRTRVCCYGNKRKINLV